MDRIDRLHAWTVRQPALRVFTVIVRVTLAVAFVPSGLVKILGQPFTSLPTSDPVGFFFAGFFSAHGYYRFVGVAQWTASALLLIPRTAALGAFVYLPIIVNIFAITVGIGPAFAGTRIITGLMLLGDIYLICWDWDRWKRILPFGEPIEARHGAGSTVAGLMLAGLLALRGVTRLHLARLRHASYLAPGLTLAAGTLLGLAMLIVAYRHAKQAGAASPGSCRPACPPKAT
jgi:hypothetical protein